MVTTVVGTALAVLGNAFCLDSDVLGTSTQHDSTFNVCQPCVSLH